MSTELAVQDRPAALTVAPRYTDEQVQLLIDTVARGCEPAEFKLFLQIAQMSRLNPFTGQIRPVKRWNSDLGREAMVVQTGIDGYRAIASRTGNLAGIEDAVFDREDEDHPNWAKVTVYRWSHGEKIAFSTTARWKEYVQKKKGGEPNSMWMRMPYLMLAKCAEALALRKAFPDELTGVYTDEEMGQADNPSDGGGKPTVTMPKRSSEKQAEPAKNGGTQSAAPAPEKVEGVIEKMREGQNGAQWLALKDGRIVHLSEKFAEEGIKEGVQIVVAAVKVERDKQNTYYGVVEVLDIGGGAPPAEASAERQAEFVQELDPDADNGTINLGDLMEQGAVKKASDIEAPKAGVIGSKMAGRLYAMMNNPQNKKVTGLTQDIVHKIIAQAPFNITSLSDLPTDMKGQFEKIMSGEIGWKTLLEE